MRWPEASGDWGRSPLLLVELGKSLVTRRHGLGLSLVVHPCKSLMGKQSRLEGGEPSDRVAPPRTSTPSRLTLGTAFATVSEVIPTVYFFRGSNLTTWELAMRIILQQLVGLVIILSGTRAWSAAPETISAAQGASFDCGRASTRIERLVCSDGELAALDGYLAAAYQQRLTQAADTEPLRAAQRAWLRDVRNRCETAACLQAAYAQRLDALEGDMWGFSPIRGLLR